MRRYFTTFIFLFLLFSSAVVFAELTGEAVTGEITNQNLNMSIYVSLSSSIISPENKTYIDNSIFLNYTSNGLSTWYNIDNSTNITLNSPVYFNTTEGSHTINLFANNSEGEVVAKSTTFYVNSSLLTILYDEYKGIFKGDSTNFSRYAYEDLQDLDDIILENIVYGKIQFNEQINLTDDLNPNDGIVDIDSNSDISINNIELNTTGLPNFNVPATIWFYNLTFNNPRILKNGVVCSSPECVFGSYSGGVLKFNITEFASYSIEETPDSGTGTGTGTGGGGGGGGSGGVSVISPGIEYPDFIVFDPNKIKISLEQGEEMVGSMVVTSNYHKTLYITLDNSMLGGLVKLNMTGFSLNPGESKTIYFKIITNESTIPDLYIARFIFTSGGTERQVLAFIEVESKGALFGVQATIPEKYAIVYPRGDFIANINIFNFERTLMNGVNIEYVIVNQEGNTIVSKNEILDVDKQIKFTRGFRIPANLEEGEYLFYVKATYNDKTVSASSSFSVSNEAKPFIKKYSILYLQIVSVILILFLVFMIIYRRYKYPKKYPKKYRKKLKKDKNN